MLSSYAGLVFDVLYLMRVAYVFNTIYQMQEKIKKKINEHMRIELIL